VFPTLQSCVSDEQSCVSDLQSCVSDLQSCVSDFTTLHVGGWVCLTCRKITEICHVGGRVCPKRVVEVTIFLCHGSGVSKTGRGSNYFFTSQGCVQNGLWKYLDLLHPGPGESMYYKI
jgi:hypothetical protein